jgi:pimeloyl-ACP methyl ester carboxylesterase
VIFFVACAHTLSSPFVQGPQGRLHVDDGGSGRGVPVLFVHGNGANLTQWRHQLEHVRATRRAVAFDLRGMGQSDPARDTNYSVDAMTDDVQAVADALHLRRFIIVGHSYGGAVVAAYAAKHPERVAGVVFADAGGSIKMTDEQANRFLDAIRKNKDAVVRQWFAPILAHGTEATKQEVLASVDKTAVDPFVGALVSMRTFDPVAAVNAYHGPILAIAATPTEGPSSLHVQVPSLHVVKMDDVSHWLMLDKPDEFNRILDGFLAEVDASKSRH